MLRFTTRLVSLVLTVLSVAGPAFAHGHLQSAKPADKASLATPPTELELTFSEPLNLKFSGATITGQDKRKIEIGDATVANDGTTLTVPVSAPLAAGTYIVEWHVLSTDGHKTKGSYSFSVEP